MAAARLLLCAHPDVKPPSEVVQGGRTNGPFPHSAGHRALQGRWNQVQLRAGRAAMLKHFPRSRKAKASTRSSTT